MIITVIKQNNNNDCKDKNKFLSGLDSRLVLNNKCNLKYYYYSNMGGGKQVLFKT